MKMRIATKPPPPNFSSQPMSSIVKSGLPSASRPPAALPVRYAAAAAAAVNAGPAQNGQTAASSSSQTQNASAVSQNSVETSASAAVPTTAVVSPQPLKALAQDQISRASSSPSLTHPSVSATSPILSSIASLSNPQNEESLRSTNQSPALSEAVPVHIDVPAATSSPIRMAPQNSELRFTLFLSCSQSLFSSFVTKQSITSVFESCTFLSIVLLLYSYSNK